MRASDKDLPVQKNVRFLQLHVAMFFIQNVLNLGLEKTKIPVLSVESGAQLANLSKFISLDLNRKNILVMLLKQI